MCFLEKVENQQVLFPGSVWELLQVWEKQRLLRAIWWAFSESVAQESRRAGKFPVLGLGWLQQLVNPQGKQQLVLLLSKKSKLPRDLCWAGPLQGPQVRLGLFPWICHSGTWYLLLESLLFQDSCLQGQMWVYAELYGLNPGQDFSELWTNTDKGFFIYKGKQLLIFYTRSQGRREELMP